MQIADWIIVGAYLVGMLLLAWLLGRRQSSGRDYFLGGNRISPATLATSTIATQCSTNSLLGAPAFVAFSAGGGLLWLQYELAVPLAMLLLVSLLATVRQSGAISVYAFLEDRLGPRARLLASSVFLVFRGVATGVTVYGVAVMVTLLVDVTYTQAVLLLMAVTVLYDVMGGMRAVVYSDAVQLVLIIVTVLVCLLLIVSDIGGWAAFADFQASSERGAALDFSWGLTGTGDFGFWPMLIGGLFLYMAYYGCDQSQAQRVLSARSPADAERVLLWAGLLRFPIVLTYCVLGLALAAYAAQQPAFLDLLPETSSGSPNYNLAVPAYVLETFPVGVVGLVMVGIFAAAMSSIDSALNALSAATLEDHVSRYRTLSERQNFIAAKLATFAWGAFAVIFSYQVEHIAPTVLEAINKIGSMANGPLLGLFAIALLLPGTGERRAIIGFIAGLLGNVALWAFAPGVSWLWWNVAGAVIALVVALSGSVASRELALYRATGSSRAALLGMTGLILAVCAAFGTVAAVAP